jgi:hypothetical protein
MKSNRIPEHAGKERPYVQATGYIRKAEHNSYQ